MGYTHYFYINSELNQENFNSVLGDFKLVLPKLEHLGVKLAGQNGEGKIILTKKEIAFNGLRNCGHVERDLGITWPSDQAKGVNSTTSKIEGKWFAGLKLNTRTCGGDCSHETFVLRQNNSKSRMVSTEIAYYDNDKPVFQDKKLIGKHFEFCKTAYKPYDLAVNVCLIIAKHHLGDQIIIKSDGEILNWRDGQEICQQFLGYGMDFKLEAEEDE